MKSWASRMDRVGFSATVKMSQKVREDRLAGNEVYDFTVGEPHWGTPPEVIAAIKDGLDKGMTRYSDSKGLPQLRKALSRWFGDRGIEAPENDILVTPGGKQGIYMVCQALLAEGDEAIVIPPCWVSYMDIIKLAGATPVEVGTTAANKYRPSEADLRAAITPRTKVIMTNNPSNPTGAVWESEVVEMVARVAREFDLWIVDDLVYEVFNYTGRPVPAVGALAPERTVTIGSFSKSYAMTGHRVGFIHAPTALVPQLLKLNQQSVTCLPGFVQNGAIAALENAGDFPKRMAAHFQDLSKVVRESLPGIDPGPLEGAFYAFVDIKPTGLDSWTFADRLYEQCRVAVVPGAAFGAAGEGYVRVSYATEEATLRAGLGLLAKAIKEWAPVKA